MTKNHSLLRFINRLSKRSFVWILTFTCLWLSTQLAIASHDCRMADAEATVQTLHSQHTQPLSENQDDGDFSPLCEKHCLPDATQIDSGNHVVVALIPETTQSLVYSPQSEPVPSLNCLTPPIQELTAEIRFCRFRE
ncbi:hypothetical protein EKN56_11145 [Limnobaculum zhutongyuii]|uniref:DUF2946 domain-containing protein n=1 Tax=Limnobaculum zhutongyuii TaxID=2498113 RepID=A0A411WL00_9GAMM|nr:hypothetical protein [Limnobaculum zhutongyuii]QBH96903.1 hypothetical protein EKN56_11145 [Limnobaculum zhutongyuii]TQS87007.1 hypothetical protein ELQ32_16460 [Limnobaculum zhutongyuii]